MNVMETKYELWIDTLAKEVAKREEELNRGIKTIRTEMGIGASGIPHVGSASDGIRAYAVTLGIEDLGKKSELIAFSDTRDGLRKVPSGMPDWLDKHIGQPVTDIPDPFGECHASYGEHMSSLLIDGFEKLGVKFTFMSGAEVYRKGLLDDQIHKILLNAKRIGEIVKETTGQEKFTENLPYFPTCEKCGKIYTTRSVEMIPDEHNVVYVCDQEFVGENKNTGKKVSVKGCGHKGEVSYLRGTGKLSWKTEFAARWAALQISFEAYGKDIADSVKVNDRICKEVLGFEPPMHIMYELFLQKGGKKISKSAGNVFTPQVWLRYGTPQSLMLLMLKRFQGTRELDVTDIPKYMDEVNHLERVYFGVDKVDDREKENLTRLFEYINLLKEIKKEPAIPYSVFVEIAKILPDNGQEDFAINKLKEQGYLSEGVAESGTSLDSFDKKFIRSRLELAKNWVVDFETSETAAPNVKVDKEALMELISVIEENDEADILQSEIFEVSKRRGIKPAEFFKMIYGILLNSERGPRLGSYILERGKKEVVDKIKSRL